LSKLKLSFSQISSGITELLELMDTSSMEIRIEGHTDNVGDELALILLQERAGT
jgi:outer membrane protein OmpA-like peptidoglycan-associated protein